METLGILIEQGLVIHIGDFCTFFKIRIPNYSNYKLMLSNSNLRKEYSLDLKKAEFVAKFESEEFLVKHQVLVHRVYTRTIVNVVTGAVMQESDSDLVVDIALEVGLQSEDITNTDTIEIELEQNNLGIDKVWYRCETTLEVEFSQYQQATKNICFAWMEPWYSGFSLHGQDSETINRVFITVVDDSIEDILEEIKMVSSNSLDDLLTQHYNSWGQIWSSGNVQVEGDKDLARVILASQYYLYSSLPVPELSSRPLPDFCGLSPGGLSYGFKGKDYQGHSFWDTSIWMYPPVLVLQPSMARSLVDYRWGRLGAALDYASNTGWSGARYVEVSKIENKKNRLDQSRITTSWAELCHRSNLHLNMFIFHVFFNLPSSSLQELSSYLSFLPF